MDAICTRGERQQTLRLITDECGWYRPGSDTRTVVRSPVGGMSIKLYAVFVVTTPFVVLKHITFAVGGLSMLRAPEDSNIWCC
jgi:hypothetical protein